MVEIGYSDIDNRPVDIPGSKSVAARALILGAVFGDWYTISNCPDCDDTEELSYALWLAGEEYDNPEAVYDLGSGATSFRFFLAYMASQPIFSGIIDCGRTLRHRPVAPLVDALRQAGADIEYAEEEGRPPLRVRGRVLRGEGVRLPAGVSSQFTSALMMASLIWDSPFEPDGEEEVSRPYIEMTARMIADMKRRVDDNTDGFAMTYKIEGDWSSASYFYELALIRPDREIRLCGLLPPGESLQGDSACVDIFGRAGVSSRFDDDGMLVICGDGQRIGSLAGSSDGLRFDMRDNPDLVPALAVGMCMAGIRFHISGVAHLRFKECDRAAALVRELARLGFVLTDVDGTLVWDGSRKEVRQRTAFDAHEDHRMVMALAMTAAALGSVRMKDHEAVSKSFPQFFDRARQVGISLRKIRRGKNSSCQL